MHNILERGKGMKLYTKNVCPKCMYVKSEIERLGVDVEIINIDKDEKAKELVLETGFMAAPLLEHNGFWYADVPQILTVLESQE